MCDLPLRVYRGRGAAHAAVGLGDLDPPSFTVEELLDQAQASGVERVVLIGHGVFHGYDNSYMLDARRRFPGVGAGEGLLAPGGLHGERAHVAAAAPAGASAERRVRRAAPRGPQH